MSDKPASTMDQLQAAFGAMSNGQNPAEAVAANSGETSESDYIDPAEQAFAGDNESTPIESLLDDKFGHVEDTTVSAEETEEDSSLSQPNEAHMDVQSSDSETGLPMVEKVTVTDSKGRKKQIDVDFNDREKLKKYVHMAAGMRKFQAERDALKKQIQSFGNVDEATEKVKLFNELDTIYQNDGSEGLINRLAGSSDAYDKLKQDIIEEYQKRQSASPSELARMDYEKEKIRQQRELEMIRQENEQFKTSIQEKETQAQLKSLQSTVNTSFDKYRFSGKLEDADQEFKLDKAIWSTAQAELSELEDQGVELTNAVVERVFRETAVPFRKFINKQSRAKLKKAINKKKQESASSVQTRIKSSMSSGSTADRSQLVDAFKRGQGTSALLDLWAKGQSKRNK